MLPGVSGMDVSVDIEELEGLARDLRRVKGEGHASWGYVCFRLEPLDERDVTP
jgi:hypothetical protein